MSATVVTTTMKIIDPEDPLHERVLFTAESRLTIPDPSLVRLKMVEVIYERFHAASGEWRVAGQAKGVRT